MRSGTVTKAKEPARVIIRGTANRRSLGEGLRNEVAFDAESLTCPKIDARKEMEEGKSESSALISGASPPEATVLVEDIRDECG